MTEFILYYLTKEFQILIVCFVKRKLESSALSFSSIEAAKSNTLRQKAKIVQGIEKEIAQKITKEIKSSKLKVQISIRGEELRVSGNKRDILQEVISIVKSIKINQPLQFINFRD